MNMLPGFRTIASFAMLIVGFVVFEIAWASAQQVGGSSSSVFTQPYVLTTTSATGCTYLGPGGTIATLVNAGATSNSTITLYDESSTSPACASGDQRFSVALAGSASQPLGLGFKFGVVYKLSAAPTANIEIQPR